MKKEVFVTAGLCRIKDQIAEAARNTAVNPQSEPDAPAEEKVSVFSSLPEETRKALQARVQEYENVRRDLCFRLHEAAAKASARETETEKNSEVLQKVNAELKDLLQKLDQQQELDEFSPEFQMRLSDNFRELDRFRLELIHLQSLLPEKMLPEIRTENNLFADLDSVSFSQLFRIGAALFLPLLLTILLCSIIIALTVALTFRVGL